METGHSYKIFYSYTDSGSVKQQQKKVEQSFCLKSTITFSKIKGLNISNVLKALKMTGFPVFCEAWTITFMICFFPTNCTLEWNWCIALLIDKSDFGASHLYPILQCLMPFLFQEGKTYLCWKSCQRIWTSLLIQVEKLYHFLENSFKTTFRHNRTSVKLHRVSCKTVHSFAERAFYRFMKANASHFCTTAKTIKLFEPLSLLDTCIALT